MCDVSWGNRPLGNCVVALHTTGHTRPLGGHHLSRISLLFQMSHQIVELAPPVGAATSSSSPTAQQDAPPPSPPLDGATTTSTGLRATGRTDSPPLAPSTPRSMHDVLAHLSAITASYTSNTTMTTTTTTTAAPTATAITTTGALEKRLLLINDLYDAPLHAVEPVLLQMVHVALTQPCEVTVDKMRRLLVHIAAQSFLCALRIVWIVDSVAPIFEKQGFVASIEGLRDQIETAAVSKRTSMAMTSSVVAPPPAAAAALPKGAVGRGHGTSPPATAPSTAGAAATGATAASAPFVAASITATTGYAAREAAVSNTTTGATAAASASDSPPLTVDAAAIGTETARKQARSIAFNDVRTFAHQCTQISAALRAMPDRSKRKAELQQQLSRVSVTLPLRRVLWPVVNHAAATVATSTLEVGGGPHNHRSGDTGGISAANSSVASAAVVPRPVPKWVVRIVHEQCIVFSSRERAPFLLLAEVVSDPSCTWEDPVRGRALDQAISTLADRVSLGAWVPPAACDEAASTGGRPPPPLQRNAAGGDLEDDFADSGTAGTTAVRTSIGGAPPVMVVDSVLQDVFGDSYAKRVEKIRRTSPFSSLPGWHVEAVVVKEGDDLRQEELALQLITFLHQVWTVEAGLTTALRPYVAMATTFNGGLIEFIADSTSIDSMKKAAKVNNVQNFFIRAYGGEGTTTHRLAQRNFVESMAAYSLVSYLLSIKDRHNANLMMSRAGHLIHIDFGFIFCTSPGGMNFESAPFKLTRELIDVMGGVHSDTFAYFKLLIYAAMIEIRDRVDDLVSLIALLLPRTTLPCFGGDGAKVVQSLRDKITAFGETPEEIASKVRQIVDESVDNWRTKGYDQFQTWQNGII